VRKGILRKPGRTRREALTAAAVLLAMPASALRASAQTVLPLAVADGPFDAGAAPFYAREVGIFKKYGLDVTIQDYSSNGPAMAAAVLGGSVDIGVSNLVSLVISHTKNIPLTLVAPTGLYSSTAPITSLMVATNSPLKTAKDLDGKTIGVNGLRNLSQYGPEAWIDKNGGDSRNSKYVEIPASALVAALAEGRIDAAIITEPFIGPARKVARIFCNPFDAIAPSFMISAFFATTAWARAHPEHVRRYQDALREAAHWANANRDRSADILGAVTHTDPVAIRAMNRSILADRLDPVYIQPVIDVTARYGGITPFKAEDLIFKG
jgi:NitT/TauT family transport system substrate-binding protein